MKKSIFYLVASAILLVACEKETILTNASVSKSQKTISTNMRSFTSMENLYEEIEHLMSLDEQELRHYENSIGFQSFGNIAESIYYPIVERNEGDIEIEQANNYIDAYPDFLELTVDIDEEGNENFSFVPKYDVNLFRYVMNEDRMFRIRDSIYRVFANAVIGIHQESAEKLFDITEENIASADFTLYHVLYDNLKIQKLNIGQSITFTKIGSNIQERVYMHINAVPNTSLTYYIIHQAHVLVRGQWRGGKKTNAWVVCKRTLNTDYNIQISTVGVTRSAYNRYKSSKPEYKHEKMVIPMAATPVPNVASYYKSYCYLSQLYGNVWIATSNMNFTFR